MTVVIVDAETPAGKASAPAITNNSNLFTVLPPLRSGETVLRRSTVSHVRGAIAPHDDLPAWLNGRNQGDEARGDHGTVEQKGVPGSWRLLAAA